MKPCTFCKIINRELPAHIINEDNDTIVFLSLEKHPLIAPKKHIPDIFSLDDATGASIIKKSAKIARALKEGLRCDGVYVTQANGVAAGQDVFHYHMHLYPRWQGKDPGQELKEDKKLLVEKIRSKLS